MLKKLVIVGFLICVMSSVFAKSNQLDTSKSKQIDARIVKSMNAIEKWEIKPPYTGWGFGVWPDDQRIQKIIVHVNPTLSNSNERSETIKLYCNGTQFIIEEGETVVCERSLDNHAMIELVKDYKHTGLRSEGTVRFIMEDV